MYKEIIDAIAPTGILRAAVNLGNTLLISSQKPDGTPVGVSPDLVHRIAQDLNIPYKFVCFECPGDLADSVDKNVWDIGNIAYEQTRAQKIEFSNPYILIDANFLVRQTAIFQTNNDVDKLGVRIAEKNIDQSLKDNELTKKEALELNREIIKMDKNLGGIKKMKGIPSRK